MMNHRNLKILNTLSVYAKIAWVLWSIARKSKKLKELVGIFSENEIDYTKDIDVVAMSTG
jgi:hypothetical protein